MSVATNPPAPPGYRQPLHLALTARASDDYRVAGRFAHGFAKGKLGRDPLFIDMLRHGVFPAEGRFLDLGCGQAVFAAWLLAAQELAQAGQWPPGWRQPPRVTSLLGLELMPSDVARANAALARFAPRVAIQQGDITQAPFPACEVVTILDVLHYFDHDRQRDVLTRVHRALTPGGVLVARVGDAAAGWRFELSRQVDQWVTCVMSPLPFRTSDAVVADTPAISATCRRVAGFPTGLSMFRTPPPLVEITFYTRPPQGQGRCGPPFRQTASVLTNPLRD